MTDPVLSKKIKPGYRALFYGLPGTGKKLAVTVIGKTSGRKVYKVNLCVVLVNTPAGTINILSGLFEKAAAENWILFFERTEFLLDEERKEYNQQIAYLLQRIEDHPGLVVLAANVSSAIDEAFARRFHSVIHFTMPSADERYRLWQDAFSGAYKPAADIDLREIAENYELTGGAIINVLRYCALLAISRGITLVTNEDLSAAIAKELKNQGA